MYWTRLPSHNIQSFGSMDTTKPFDLYLYLKQRHWHASRIRSDRVFLDGKFDYEMSFDRNRFLT